MQGNTALFKKKYNTWHTCKIIKHIFRHKLLIVWGVIYIKKKKDEKKNKPRKKKEKKIDVQIFPGISSLKMISYFYVVKKFKIYFIILLSSIIF